MKPLISRVNCSITMLIWFTISNSRQSSYTFSIYTSYNIALIKASKNIKIKICCGLFYIQWLEMKRWLLILLILLWWSTKISSFCGKIVTAFITTNITTCINWKCIWWLPTVWNGKPYQHSYWAINPGNQRFHEQLTLEIRG
jgi:hypothetical protein